jgi:hypothetical protein
LPAEHDRLPRRPLPLGRFLGGFWGWDGAIVLTGFPPPISPLAGAVDGFQGDPVLGWDGTRSPPDGGVLGAIPTNLWRMDGAPQALVNGA